MTIIEPAHYKTFSERFTREHDGWSASLELRQPDGGIDVAVDDRPFRGLTFEKRDAREKLILTFGDDADEHLAHIVERPHDVTVLEKDERQCSLVIGLADRSGCVLELTNPFVPD